MLGFAVITLASVLAGYGLGLALVGSSADETAEQPTSTRAHQSPAVPWFQTQSPPPSMIRMASPPLFPDVIEDQSAQPVLPYEEALPTEVYIRPRAVTPPAAPVFSTPPPERPARPPRVAKQPAVRTPPAPTQPAEKPSGDVPPWQQFALAAVPDKGLPRIVIVIDDLGIDKKRTRQVIDIKSPLTLSFLTYATALKQQTRAARANGHELLVHIPMEPSNATLDPGPNVLIKGLAPEELLKRLRWGLSQFDSYIGINNHMGSKFTSNPEGMTVVLAELKRRGLMFLDSVTTGKSVGHLLATRLGLPFAERNVFLDNQDDVAAVRERLKALESVAKRHGYAVAIGHPKSATIEALRGWLPTLAERGFQIVPLSAVVQIPAGAG